MRVLVTGGAGYIGSHTVIQLAAAGHEPIVVDNFCNAKASVVPRLEALIGSQLEVHEFDLADQDRIDALFADRAVDAVIHFAGFKTVAESVLQPLNYYRNNLSSTFALLRAMQRHGVWHLVFSSSATVYGADAAAPIREDSPTMAINPYGWTKVMIEQVLRDVATADHRWRIALLRYFNPCGAHHSGTLGEQPARTPTNLVPLMAQVAAGERESLPIFGGDYPTPDGTAIRDYIHVEDLAGGHLAALSRLNEVDQSIGAWNLGTGRGTSVLEVLHAFERVCGRRLPYETAGRRAGDVAVSYADATRAHAELGWRATRDLDQICADHWRWQTEGLGGKPP